ANVVNRKRRTIKTEEVYEGLHSMEFMEFVPYVQRETALWQQSTKEHQLKLRAEKEEREARALEDFMRRKAMSGGVGIIPADPSTSTASSQPRDLAEAQIDGHGGRRSYSADGRGGKQSAKRLKMSGLDEINDAVTRAMANARPSKPARAEAERPRREFLSDVDEAEEHDGAGDYPRSEDEDEDEDEGEAEEFRERVGRRGGYTSDDNGGQERPKLHTQLNTIDMPFESIDGGPAVRRRPLNPDYAADDDGSESD
ncbi:hypothetical protein KEM52_002883, partial [Ascosphaera acerosa]